MGRVDHVVGPLWTASIGSEVACRDRTCVDASAEIEFVRRAGPPSLAGRLRARELSPPADPGGYAPRTQRRVQKEASG